LRIGLLGGGSDLDSFLKKCSEHNIKCGKVLNVAINKYVYVLVKKRHDDFIYLKYSDNEVVYIKNIDKIKHDFIRETLKYLNIDFGVEIINWADVPTKGTGLGSSSSFLVALLLALHSIRGELVTKDQLAKEACHIEINLCKKPIGYQDQYAAAFGGMNYFIFKYDKEIDKVNVNIENVDHISKITGKNLFSYMLLYYTGKYRLSSDILEKQSVDLVEDDAMISRMKDNINLVEESIDSMQKGYFIRLGYLLKKNWELKKTFSKNMSNKHIDDIYSDLENLGMVGGKITGAGGGGFLLAFFREEDKFKIKRYLNDKSVLDNNDGRIMNINIDELGARIIFNEDTNGW